MEDNKLRFAKTALSILEARDYRLFLENCIFLGAFSEERAKLARELISKYGNDEHFVEKRDYFIKHKAEGFFEAFIYDKSESEMLDIIMSYNDSDLSNYFVYELIFKPNNP